MGPTAGNSCFYSLALATLILLLLIAATASTAIPAVNTNATVSPFCTSPILTAADDKALCTRLVNDAETWPEAMTNAIKGVIGLANAAKPTVIDGLGALLPPELNPVAKDGICSVCREMFESYVFHLGQCIGFVKTNDTSSLKTYFSSSMFSYCGDALADRQLSLPVVDRFNEQTLKFTGILLAILKKQPQSQIN